MKLDQKYQCKSCGREIRLYNVENFQSYCADCWYKYKDENKEEKKEQNQICYECGKQGFVVCGRCHKSLCADHTLPSHSWYRKFICLKCYLKSQRHACIILVVGLLVIFGSLFIYIVVNG